MKLPKILFCITMMSVTPLSSGQSLKNKTEKPSEPAAMTLEELKELQNGLSTAQQVKVQFVLNQSRKLRKKPIIKNGEAQFAKPNMFLWHVKTEPEVVQYFDGKNFFQHYPEKSLAQQITPTGEMYTTISNLIDVVMNWDSLLKNYDISNKVWLKNTAGKDGSIYLIPKNKDSDLTGINLLISSEFKFVKEVELNYKSGNVSKIQFSNLVRTQKNLNAFKFSKPAGTKLEVIR